MSESRSSKMPSVAIVILTYNGLDYLKDFLPGVLASSYPNKKVVIIDNNSEEAICPFVKNEFPEVELIKNSSNEGFAGGYNTGMSQVEADYFVLLNNDIEVEPGWIEPIIELMEANKEIGACQPKIRSWHKKDHFEYAGACGGFLDTMAYPFCRGRIFDSIEKDEGQYDSTIDCFWASGAALFIRSFLWKQFEGLDRDFFAHMEEIDLCWRIKNAGYSIKVVPDSVVYHVGGGTLPYNTPNKLYLNYRNNLFMLHKNEAQLWWKLPVRLALDVVSAYRFLLMGSFSYWKAIAKAHIDYFTQFFYWQKKRRATFLNREKHKISEKNNSGRYQQFIIIDYFLRGNKYFNQLKQFERNSEK